MMDRIRSVAFCTTAAFALSAGALAALAPVATAGRTDTTQMLYVTFNGNHTFTMTAANGTPVGSASPPGTVITPGTYEILFDDTANVKDMTFQLSGPGVTLQEDMSGGEETTIGDYATFQPSASYSFHDARNSTSPSTFFSTAASGGTTGGTGAGQAGAGTATQTTSTGSTDVVGSKAAKPAAPVVSRGALGATVSGIGNVTLTKAGKAVKSLKAGRYTVTIADSTSKDGLALQSLKGNTRELSGVGFTGKKTVTVTLTAGQWSYYGVLGTKNHPFTVTA